MLKDMLTLAASKMPFLRKGISGESSSPWMSAKELHDLRGYDDLAVAIGADKRGDAIRLGGGRPVFVASSRMQQAASAVAVPAALEYAHSVVVFDSSLDGLISARTRRCREEKYSNDIFVLTPGGVDGFNPLDTLDPDSEGFKQDVLDIALSLAGKMPAEESPYFHQNGVALFSIAAASLIDLRKRSGGSVTLADIFSLFVGNVEECLSRLADLRGSEFAANLDTYTTLDERTFGEVIKTIHLLIGWVADEKYSHLVNGSSFHPDKLLDQQTTIYLNFPFTAEYVSTPARFLMEFFMRKQFLAPVGYEALFIVHGIEHLEQSEAITKVLLVAPCGGVRIVGSTSSLSNISLFCGKPALSAWIECSGVRLFSDVQGRDAEFVSELLGEAPVYSGSGFLEIGRGEGDTDLRPLMDAADLAKVGPDKWVASFWTGRAAVFDKLSHYCPAERKFFEHPIITVNADSRPSFEGVEAVQ